TRVGGLPSEISSDWPARCWPDRASPNSWLGPFHSGWWRLPSTPRVAPPFRGTVMATYEVEADSYGEAVCKAVAQFCACPPPEPPDIPLSRDVVRQRRAEVHNPGWFSERLLIKALGRDKFQELRRAGLEPCYPHRCGLYFYNPADVQDYLEIGDLQEGW